MIDAERLGQQITAAVRSFVCRSLESRDARIAALERRIAEVEAVQKAARYRGTWQPGERYEKGNLATHAGSLWAAIDDSPGKPGVSGWQLAAKRGADGKDIR
jgi:hypothetical protein